VTFGILQRYVMGEVLRAFSMALATMTIIFVLFMVMAEAANIGLSPREIMRLIPFVIPSTLPFTVPVSMLFAVTVVFGRLASDNEVIAVKTAGLSAMTILWPAIILSAGLSLTLLHFSGGLIPRANQEAKAVIYKNFEEMFYKWLKVRREFDNQEWPFLIKVRDVDLETKTMDSALFKHRNKGNPANGLFDMVVSAKKANIKFDVENHVALVYLVGSETTHISRDGKKEDIFLIDDKVLELPLPGKNTKGLDKSIKEWTTPELVAEQANYRAKIAHERRRQAIRAALRMASGRFDRVDWRDVQLAFNDYGFWNRKLSEFETEKQFRVSQSVGTLIFVLLGAPVGILFARRDFLSAFITCFMPIILVYYPLLLLGINLGKEDVLNPVLALWSGNLLLGVASGFVLPSVLRH